MANIGLLAELLRNNAAGYGESTVDKLNRMFGTIGTAGTDLTQTGKNYQDIQESILKQQAAKEAIAKAQREQKIIPSTQTDALTPEIQSDLSNAQQADIPAQDLISGNLNNRQMAIDAAKQKILGMQATNPGRTRGEMDTDAGIKLKEAQTNYYNSGQKGGDKMWVNPETGEISNTDPIITDPLKVGFVKVPNSTAANIRAAVLKGDVTFAKQLAMLQAQSDIGEAKENRVKFKDDLDKINNVIQLTGTLDKVLDKIPAGIQGGFESVISKSGYGFPDAAAYNRTRSAAAVSFYRASTGDTRLSDADAEARALPLLSTPGMSKPQRDALQSLRNEMLNDRKTQLEKGIQEVPWDSIIKSNPKIASLMEKMGYKKPETPQRRSTDTSGLNGTTSGGMSYEVIP